jgi:ELWxxDGT repeat protein
MAQSKQTHQNLQVEALERREMLSGTPQLVADFNLEPQSQEYAWLNNEVFFAADDGTGDVELWKSDGTPAGTVRVKDIRPGSQSSLLRGFVEADGFVLFTVYNDQTGRELWATDGTEAGTRMVREFAPGWNSISPGRIGGKVYFTNTTNTVNELWVSDGTEAGTQLLNDRLVSFYQLAGGDRLFFSTYEAEGGAGLWASDGTLEGTARVNFPGDDQATWISHLVDVAGRLFFTTSDEVGNQRLWTSDGTEEGTTVVDTAGELGQIRQIAVAGQLLVFLDSQGSLWRSDGTRDGTLRLEDFGPDSYVRALTQFGERITFFADGRLWASDGTREGTLPLRNFGPDRVLDHLTQVGEGILFYADYQIWTSDGTSEGTLRLRNFGPGTFLEEVTHVGERVFFIANDIARDRLWVSDGTVAGTTLVPGVQNPSRLSYANGFLYFVQDRNDVGKEMWRTDGTAEGTRLIDVSPGPTGSDPGVLSGKDGTTLFWATAGESRGLWTTTDNDAQVTLLKDAIAGPSGGLNAKTILTEVNGKILVWAADRLWQTDGIDTWQVEAAPPLVHEPTVVGDQLYFVDASRFNSGARAELWRTDGSNEGTVRVTGSDDRFWNPFDLTHSGGALYFWADGDDQRLKLWKIDSTESAAVVVKNLERPRGVDDLSKSMTDLNGTLFFTFQRGSNMELWKTDGPEGSLELVAVIPATEANLLPAESQLFLSVEYNYNKQLWRSDGTPQGTYQLTDASSYVPIVVGDKLFFLGYDAGYKLWVSDGSVDGTRLVRDVIDPKGSNCCLAPMMSSGDTLYFIASDEDGVQGLWKSDGSEEGTVLVRNMDANLIGGGDGVVYFEGSDASSGSELWRSDGTEEGTVLVVDLNPGPGGSSKYYTPRTAAEINGHLYFTGDDGFHGFELWRIPLDTGTSPVIGDANGDGRFDSSDLVQVFQAGEFEDQIPNNSTWEEGDWNGDGDFTTADLVLALQSGSYVAAAVRHWQLSDVASLFDWASEQDHRKRSKPDPDSVDETFKQTILQING